MVYTDDKQHEEHWEMFKEKIELKAYGKPVLAIALRGVEAGRKINDILGHANPEMARRTDEKSLRACFGVSKVDNCAVQIFDKGKRFMNVKFWFGGRVQTDKFIMTP